ncbi:MAG: ABC transporter substrate-binding protein, partial [Pseudomonadota bacterium]
QGFWLNTRRAKFRDPRVRRAFDLAFDFEWSNQALFYNLYQRTHGIFQNSDLAAGEGAPPAAVAAVLGEIEGAPEGAFGEAYTPAASDGSGRNRRNLARASRLLTDAGWRLEDGVRVNADGVALEVEFLDRTSSGFDRIIEPYIRNLERLGVRARLREVDPAQYELRQKDFDYDIVTARFAWLATPGPELKGFFGSESAAAAGSFNLSGVSSPAVDALLERIEAARSREELRVATDALDRVLRAGHYWVPHWYKAAHHLAYWNRFGRPMDMGLPKPRYARGVISTWWVDEAKAAAIDAQR